jgi:predicted ATPase
MRQRLRNITITGFKTIEELRDFQPQDLTVLIGPNGAGKSNFISLFRLLSWALASPGQLQEYIGLLGGASTLLHDGPARTRDIEAQLVLETDAGDNEYSLRLAYAGGDTLIYTDEKYRFSSLSHPSPFPAPWKTLGAGHREAALIGKAESGDKTAKTIHGLLRRIVVYQFHNTSETSRIRQKWNIEEGQWLKEDAGNLGAVLYRLRRDHSEYYRRILENIRLILPFFADFHLQPEFGKILLSWRERGSDLVFTANQAADGMLRILALVTLLQMPEWNLPNVLILDEPELGLHPYAIEVLAGLIRAASKSAQVILATQSVSLIDRFAPQEIVVVDRPGRESRFRRLDGNELTEWLDEYSLSELWEKNVIGGRPAI